MKAQFRLLAVFVFLLSAMNIKAHNEKMPVSTYDKAAEELQESWWGYFDGDYENISVIGLGSSFDAPIDYNCAIRIKAGNPELLGKRIKALKYSFERLNYIENVSVWMSKELPVSANKADICCVPVDKSTLKSFEKDNDVNVTQFPEPYQVGNEDIYVGYSFTVTSNEGDLCTSPIVVSYASTMENAFLMNFGSGWIDNAGRNYGNLAFMLLVDDGGEFLLGDVNYDMKINVADVSCTTDYILNGKGGIFNTKGADIDANGEINVVDVESIIDMILERNTVPAQSHKDSGDVLMAESLNGNTVLRLHADNEYRGFQMDIVVPEGSEITSVETGAAMTSTHNLRYARIADNRYRVVVSSDGGSVIEDEDILNINADTDDVRIENIVFATTDLQVMRFADIKGSGTASVDNISCDEHKDNVYSISGIRVNPDELQKGVYIVNGKKIIVK